MHLQKPARSDEFAGHVDVQMPPAQTPLTQLASVAQLCPRLLRQSFARATYVFPAGQSHVFVTEFQFPAPEQEHWNEPGPPDVEPPPQAVHGVSPEPGL